MCTNTNTKFERRLKCLFDFGAEINTSIVLFISADKRKFFFFNF